MPTALAHPPFSPEMKTSFAHWEKTKDVIDQCIDIMLNHRQSGHPGGSRSKVHVLLVTLLSSNWIGGRIAAALDGKRGKVLALTKSPA